MSGVKNLNISAQRSNLICFALWALVEAVQWIIVVSFIFSFIPMKSHPFATNLFEMHRKGVQPEREMSFYRLFVVMAVGLYASSLFLFRRRLDEAEYSRKVLHLTAVNAVLIFVQLFAIFKIFVLGNPGWARYILYAGLAAAVVTRVFWPEIRTWAPQLYARFVGAPVGVLYSRIGDAVFVFFIGLLIFVPDMTKVLARMFTRDEFYHVDSLLMAPGWAHLNGLVLNKDVTSQYSVLLPSIISHIAQWIGGFNYHNVVAILIAGTILYFIGLYFFLKRWLESALIAAFGVLLAIKLQMFHWGVSPLIWQFPSATVIRYVFDILALWLVWQHCSSGKRGYLWGAAVVCGVAWAYMCDTGLYLTAAFYAYLVGDVFLSQPGKKLLRDFKSVGSLIGLFLLPIFVGFFVLFCFEGSWVFTSQFRANAGEFAGLFLQGWGALPMYDGLKDRQFFAFIMGFVIPLVYTATALMVGALCFLRQIDRRNFFVVVICIYGLGLYHYFINRSAVSSYYVGGIPFVAVICYWLKSVTATLGFRLQSFIRLAAFVVMVPALMTSYLMTHYPNVFGLSGNEWEEETLFYKQEFNLSQDAQLIARLTKPDERVALISSFETAILMEAKRKPFYYYFPLVESIHMRLAGFRGTYLHTRDRMKKTVEQMDREKPAYIFIERKLFKRNIPPEFYELHQTLEMLIKYVDLYYEPSEDGLYLMALKRKK